MRPGRFFWKLFLGNALLLIAVVATCSWLIVGAFDRFYSQELENHLRSHAEILRYLVENRLDADHAAELDRLAKRIGSFDPDGLRVTMLTQAGAVLGDSQANPAQMENHADRPEIRRALRDGWGQSTRWSRTVGREMTYLALRCGPANDPSGAVRVSMAARTIAARSQSAQNLFWKIGLVVGTAALLLALGLARIWSRPIAQITATARTLSRGDLTAEAQVRGSDEVALLARSLNRMRDSLTRTIQARTDFVANASHELRTPLTAIQAAVETLMSIDPAAEREAHDRILRVLDSHCHRLVEMVGDLLSLSRLESPFTRFEKERLSLGELFNTVRDRFAASAGAKRIHWNSEAPDRHGSVLMSRYLLTLVLNNLVDNAIKFTESGGNISVTSRLSEDELRIAVQDSGCGIPAKEHDRIFERFYQVERARSGHHHRGTGLGLSIVRHAIRAMGGTVELDSEPGRGTKITVVIPKSGFRLDPDEARTNPSAAA